MNCLGCAPNIRLGWMLIDFVEIHGNHGIVLEFLGTYVSGYPQNILYA